MLPNIPFKEFVKNPIVALLFISLIAISYLYIDNKTTLESQIEYLQNEVKELKQDYKNLNDKFIKTIEELKNEEN